jgi:hypothetical protein
MIPAAAVKERPILFSGPMVRELLGSTKTQTRRVVKARGCAGSTFEVPAGWDPEAVKRWAMPCPYGQPGDRLWVRETHAIVPATAYSSSHDDGQQLAHRVSPDTASWAVYRAGWVRVAPEPWRPSIHLPRWACRIVLELVDVRVERLQAISEADAIAEGVERLAPSNGTLGGWACPLLDSGIGMVVDTARDAYRGLWNSINGVGSWEANPWVWVLTFKRVLA